jgi:hypothetical protein
MRSDLKESEMKKTMLWLFSGLYDKLTRYMGRSGLILYGSSGGGGNTTVTQTNIPDWLQDPTKNMVAAGEKIVNDVPYQQYGGDRVAGFSPYQDAAFQGVANMQAPQQYDQAQYALGNAQNFANAGAMDAGSYQPGMFQGAAYDPAMAQTATRFDQNAANFYMSPYQQGVTDIAKQKAAAEGQQMMNKLGATAAKNGAFGGSRFGLEQAQGLRDVGQNLSNIQVQGSQAAFDRAQNQFNQDEGRGLTTNLANQAAMNQASQFGGQNWMTAQQQAEQSRQFGASQGLQGAQLAANTGLAAANQYQSLGTTQQASELERLNALQNAGMAQQQLGQKYADVGYNNFVDARDFDRNNLQFLSGLLRGNNFGTSQSVTQPTASTTNQLAGLGIGALGAYKLFGG